MKLRAGKYLGQLSPLAKRSPIWFNQYEVELIGLDVFDPVTMQPDHRNGDDVPAWLLDTDYNELCFHVSQAFFPRTSAWDNLKKAIKGEYDEAVWDHLAGTTSAPFEAGEHGQIAVKVIDDRGNELVVVKRLAEATQVRQAGVEANSGETRDGRMTMASEVQLDSMLVRMANVCGGRLRIDGTRVTVLQIVTLYKQGETAEEIAQDFPQVNLSQVYAALAYYHANQAEVERELADEQAEFDRLKAQQAQAPKAP